MRDSEGYMLSISEGRIKVTVLDRSDFPLGFSGVIIPGSFRYLVRFEEGKHRDEEPRWVPATHVHVLDEEPIA